MFLWSLVFFGGKLGTVRLCEDVMKCEVKGKRRKEGRALSVSQMARQIRRLQGSNSPLSEAVFHVRSRSEKSPPRCLERPPYSSWNSKGSRMLDPTH